MIRGPQQTAGHGQRALVKLVPWMVAGVQTQFVHLRNEMTRSGVDHSVCEVQPWLPGGRIERLPLPSRTRGTLRSLLALHQGFRNPADALWTQVALPVLPYMLTTGWMRRAPAFYAIDCTPKLLFDQGRHYRRVTSDPGSVKGRLTTRSLELFFRRCEGLLPWSRWAANSMIQDYGADPARVHVLPPGIDTSRWKPKALSGESPRPQLLFVGADFDRKGGPLLLDIYRRHLRDTCDLHLVTKTDPGREPGVTVYTGYGPDDPGLLGLFQKADMLIVPTHADCFSMVAIEAMACAVPVVISPVGGIPEIVVDDEAGCLVPVGDGRRLLEVIHRLIADSTLRRRLGQTGREVASRRYQASTQARLMVELLLGAIGSRTERSAPSSAVRK